MLGINAQTGQPLAGIDHGTRRHRALKELRDLAVRVRMSIKPGGFDDPAQGWTGGWATQGFDTGAAYLACEGVVMDGPFAKRKIWWNVGLHSAKGPTWGNMGRTFIRAALNSARNVHPADNTPPCCRAFASQRDA